MNYRIYLDLCCFNRPYDDQSYETIRLETEAKLFIQDGIRSGEIEFVWSFMLSFENNANPYEECKESIADWKEIATVNVHAHDTIRGQARRYEMLGIDPKDALHVSCAIAGNAGYFLTTDKYLLKKSAVIKDIIIVNPIEFVRIKEGRNEK